MFWLKQFAVVDFSIDPRNQFRGMWTLTKEDMITS